jgi:hypothetical protein
MYMYENSTMKPTKNSRRGRGQELRKSNRDEFDQTAS